MELFAGRPLGRGLRFEAGGTFLPIQTGIPWPARSRSPMTAPRGWFRRLVAPPIAGAFAWILTIAPASGQESLAILPANVTLSGPEARQRLLVEEVGQDKFVGQVTDGVTFASSDPAVVKIE